MQIGLIKSRAPVPKKSALSGREGGRGSLFLFNSWWGLIGIKLRRWVDGKKRKMVSGTERGRRRRRRGPVSTGVYEGTSRRLGRS